MFSSALSEDGVMEQNNSEKEADYEIKAGNSLTMQITPIRRPWVLQLNLASVFQL